MKRVTSEIVLQSLHPDAGALVHEERVNTVRSQQPNASNHVRMLIDMHVMAGNRGSWTLSQSRVVPMQAAFRIEKRLPTESTTANTS